MNTIKYTLREVDVENKKKIKCKLTKEVIKRIQEKVIKYLRFIKKIEHTYTRALKQGSEKIMKMYISTKLLTSLNFVLKDPLYT